MKHFYFRSLAALLFAALGLAVSCSDGDDKPTSPAPGVDEQIEKWMAEYMTTHYLWNEAMRNVTPDYSLDYQAFLSKILQDIAAQNDVNHDDGHWENGRRSYFYSNIQRYALSTSQMTRGTRQTEQGTGIGSLWYGYLDGRQAPYYFQIRTVSPFSPAGEAGLCRGDYIVRINGSPIADFQAGVQQIREPDGSVTVSVAKSLTGATTDIRFSSQTYDDNPVWVVETLSAANGGKVGYLCYDAFNYYYDQQLIAAFAKFKSENVKDLILDLRFNGGGHVVSSTVLGTLIAGTPKQDQVYARTSYNAERTARHEKVDVYKIGNADIGNGTYPPIADGLAAALGLKRVHILCTGNTASSSELVINGLRGVGVEVRLIGTTTNGKNVGMESRTKKLDGYEYEFSPISFYSENAQGFRDYGSGFTPDVVVDEDKIPVLDWGSPQDAMISRAMSWIDTGSKPASQTSASLRDTRARTERFGIRAPRKAIEGMIIVRDDEAE